MLKDQIHLFISPPSFAPPASQVGSDPDQVQRTISKLFQEKAGEFEARFRDKEALAVELHSRRMESEMLQGGLFGGLCGFAVGLVVLPLIPVTTVIGAASGALCFASLGHVTYELCDIILAERLNQAGLAAAHSCNRIAQEVLQWNSIEGLIANMDQVDWDAFKERLRVCKKRTRVRKIAAQLGRESSATGLAHTRYAELKRIGKERHCLCC